MIDLLGAAPIVAAGFAVPQFLPQIRKLLTTRDTAGVSPSWAALTSVNNAAWLAYFIMSRYWTALIPSTSATLLAGTLAVLLLRRRRPGPRPPALIAASAREASLAARRLEAANAEAQIDRTVERFTSWWHGRTVATVVADLVAHAERVRQSEVERSLARLGATTERERALVEAASAAIV